MPVGAHPSILGVAGVARQSGPPGRISFAHRIEIRTPPLATIRETGSHEQQSQGSPATRSGSNCGVANDPGRFGRAERLRSPREAPCGESQRLSARFRATPRRSARTWTALSQSRGSSRPAARLSNLSDSAGILVPVRHRQAARLRKRVGPPHRVAGPPTTPPGHPPRTKPVKPPRPNKELSGNGFCGLRAGVVRLQCAGRGGPDPRAGKPSTPSTSVKKRGRSTRAGARVAALIRPLRQQGLFRGLDRSHPGVGRASRGMERPRPE